MLTYNGTNLLTAVPGLAITDIKGRGPISQELNTITVPGRPGAYYVDKTIPVRTISVAIELTGSTLADVRTKVDQLNAILKVDEPESMVFSDESTRTYYGILSGNQDWSEILFTGKGTLNFTCTDPFKYSADNNSPVYTESTTVTVNGNQETEPITTLVLKADTTFVTIYNGTTKKMNLLGMPARVTEAPAEKETVVLNADGTNFTGWTTPASTEDGTVVGSNTATGDFAPASYGTGSTWHGPASKTSIPNTPQDFRMDFSFNDQITANNQTGGMIVSILDGQNGVLAKCSIMKHYGNLHLYHISFTIGKTGNNRVPVQDKQVDMTKLKKYTGTFEGIVTITRKGDIWNFIVWWKVPGSGTYTKMDLGKLAWFEDIDSVATAAAAQVQLQFVNWGTLANITQKIGGIKVLKLNTLTSTQVPYVARNGDTVVFDHKSNIITVNGVDVSDSKAFIGEYWPLVPGSNTIIAEPYDAFTSVQTTWKDKWQ